MHQPSEDTLKSTLDISIELCGEILKIQSSGQSALLLAFAVAVSWLELCCVKMNTEELKGNFDSLWEKGKHMFAYVEQDNCKNFQETLTVSCFCLNG